MAKKIDITEENYAMLMPTGDRILVKRDQGEENRIWYLVCQTTKSTNLVLLLPWVMMKSLLMAKKSNPTRIENLLFRRGLCSNR